MFVPPLLVHTKSGHVSEMILGKSSLSMHLQCKQLSSLHLRHGMNELEWFARSISNNKQLSQNIIPRNVFMAFYSMYFKIYSWPRTVIKSISEIEYSSFDTSLRYYSIIYTYRNYLISHIKKAWDEA